MISKNLINLNLGFTSFDPQQIRQIFSSIFGENFRNLVRESKKKAKLTQDTVLIAWKPISKVKNIISNEI